MRTSVGATSHRPLRGVCRRTSPSSSRSRAGWTFSTGTAPISRRHFATFEPFAAELTRIDAFAELVWLAPAPRDRFLELITATCDRFPAFPPYESGDLEPEPHLTIGAPDERDDVEAIAIAARSELERSLPFGFLVDSVWLFEEQEDGTFAQTSRFALG